MSTSSGHLTAIPGGGEGDQDHDAGPPRPYEVYEAIAACDNRDADVAHIFDALKCDRDSSQPGQETPARPE
jgi:hypothetical protein